MDLRQLSQFLNLRDFRNAFVGFLTVVGGITLAMLTVWSHRTGNVQLAGLAAAASLVFVLLILIFVVPPLARNASEEAAQMNLPFDFTLGGAFILGLILIVGFSAWNTGNNLLFLVFSFLISALVIAFVVGGACLKRLDVKMRFPETVFAGDRTPILLTINNRKRFFPTLSVVLEVRGTEREKSRLTEEVANILPRKVAERITRPPVIKHTLDYFMFVPRNDAVESSTEKVFPSRGRFMIRDFELSTKFPFGFFRQRRRLSASQAEIVVFPRPFGVDGAMRDLAIEAGSLVSKRKGSGNDLFGLRGYEPMDDMRRVDWKATARAGELTVREFTAEDEKRVTVVLDTRVPVVEGSRPKSLRTRIDEERSGKPHPPDSERFESGVSKACGLLVHFESERAETRLVIDGEVGEFGIGRSHLNDSLRRLALIEARLLEAGAVGDCLVDFERVRDVRDAGQCFLVTALTVQDLPADMVRVDY